jgi:hypothetical protein
VTPEDFLLGVHMPSWLEPGRGREEGITVPAFISQNRLIGRKTMPAARGPVCIDSGGFMILKNHGGWPVTSREFADRSRRIFDALGPQHVGWFAPQDWMCEPVMIDGGTFMGQHFVGTGLTIAEHQRRTVANYLQLRDLAPDLPFIPVLQGWTRDDYLRCVDTYAAAGIDLEAEPVVGLGSVCRRQATTEIGQITSTLAGLGLRLHGFGVKIRGLELYADHLTSADSMAWSYDGRRTPGCAHGSSAKNEANCMPFALAWRERVLALLDTPRPAAPAVQQLLPLDLAA